MDEQDLVVLKIQIADLITRVSAIHNLLAGTDDGLSEKPGLVAICREHRKKYIDAETRLTKVEKKVESLLLDRIRIIAIATATSVCVGAGLKLYDIFK